MVSTDHHHRRSKQVNKPPWNLETVILRRHLALNGYSCPEPYEWYCGEALYYGEPIQGRATPGEQRAINAVLDAIEQENHNRAMVAAFGEHGQG